MNDSKRSDAGLVAAAQGGDHAAFRVLQAKHVDGAYDFLARVTGSEEIARDLTAKTFLHSARHLADVEPRSFRPWLYAVAMAHAIVTLRDAKRLHGVSDDPLMAAFHSVEPKSRAVLDLSVRQGLTPSELGRLLGLGESETADLIEGARLQLNRAYADVASSGQQGDEALAGLVPLVAPDDLDDSVWEEVSAELPKAETSEPRPIWPRIAGMVAVVVAVAALGLAAAGLIGDDTGEDSISSGPLPASASSSTTIATPVSPDSETTTTRASTTTSVSVTLTSVTSTTINSDNTAPTVVVIAPVSNQRFASASAFHFVDLVAAVSDDFDSGLAVEWYQGSTYLTSGNGAVFAFPTACPDSISHTVTAEAMDSGGLVGSATVTFFVDCSR